MSSRTQNFWLNYKLRWVKERKENKENKKRNDAFNSNAKSAKCKKKLAALLPIKLPFRTHSKVVQAGKRMDLVAMGLAQCSQLQQLSEAEPSSFMVMDQVRLLHRPPTHLCLTGKRQDDHSISQKTQ